MKIFLLLFFITFNEILSHSLDPENFIIYGPGLDSSLTLPVRYFFVQLVNKDLENVTNIELSRADKLIEVSFQFYSSGQLILLHHEVLYLNDGTFIIRFRLLKAIIHDNVVFTLLWLPTQTYIGKFCIILRAPLYSEKCHCPQFSLKEFLTHKLNCPKNNDQIWRDFQHFQPADFEKNFENFSKRYQPFTSVAVCRYKIISNEIYRKCFGEHVGFKMFSDAALLSLSHKAVLPDMDFLMNLGDWPLSYESRDKFNIFSWCGSDDTNDIVIPSYETMETVLEMMGRVYLDIFTALKDSNYSWHQKVEKGFWRGRDSSNARLNLVRMSLQYPDMLNARLTNMFFFSNDSTLGQLERPIPFNDFFQYKYVVNMDGTVAAYRFPLSLAGGSVILKEETKYYEYIYSQLKPYDHYLPIKTDLSDLIQKLNWCKNHDNECRQIAYNARAFIKSHFMPVDIICYFGTVLQEYADHFAETNSIVLTENYESVKDNSVELDCNCL